jgi:DHA2 family multidrug resistance protein
MSIWGVGIMIGPILGPTLGGYITEWLDWRWVFFINLPLGILTLFGLLMFVDETPKNRALPFDWTGFALLSIAVGSFQLLLDRGETLDWLGSTEIIFELIVAGLCFYLFVVHMFTSRQPFISTALFKDRNYCTAVIVIFILGSLLLATMALLPPFLEGLLGYPVDLVGEVMAPRGVGTMMSMLVAGQLINRVDPRILVASGFSLSTLSLWQMTQFNLEITPWHVVHTGFIQGLGLGLIIVPLSTIAYATLAPSLRNEGTALFSLVRNLGSSFGLSLVMAQLINNSQRHRADLVNHLGAPEIQSWASSMGQQFSNTSTQSLAMLDQMVNRQAMAMAFLDDFRLIMFASAAIIPLLVLMKPPPRFGKQVPA